MKSTIHFNISALFSFIFSTSGCTVQWNSGAQNEETYDLEGTWSGTRAIYSKMVYSNASGAVITTNSVAKNFLIIRKSNDGDLEIADCYGGFSKITPVDGMIKTKYFLPLKIISNNELANTSEENRNNSEFSSYTKVEMTLRKTDTQSIAIGQTNVNLTGANATSGSTELYCAELTHWEGNDYFGNPYKTTKAILQSGDRYNEFVVSIGTGATNYKDARVYYGDRTYGQKTDNIGSNVSVEFGDDTSNGFSIVYTSVTSEYTISGDAVINIER